MEKIVDSIQQYPLIIAILIVVILLLCWKVEAVRAWVVRLTVFALVLVAAYFVFQKVKHRLPSTDQQKAVSDDSATQEEHAGKKYYRDPAERMKEGGI